MKRFRNLRHLSLLLFATLLLTGCEQVSGGPALRIGYMNCNSEEETL